ncbi:MAG: hypothetical protein IKQ96_09515 [Lachnospiraceae bacterium]|nr:hypothetical protein [Lachnospiraceae bacterium]
MDEQKKRWLFQKAKQTALVFFVSQGVMSTLWMGKGWLFGSEAREQVEFRTGHMEESLSQREREESVEATTEEPAGEVKEKTTESTETETKEKPTETMERETTEKPTEAIEKEITAEATDAITAETTEPASVKIEGDEKTKSETAGEEPESAEEPEAAAPLERADGIGEAGLEKVRNGLKKEAEARLGEIRYSVELQNAAALRLSRGTGTVMDVLNENRGDKWRECTWKECEVYAYLLSREEDAYQALIKALSSAYVGSVTREAGFTGYGIGLSAEESEGAILVKAVIVFVKEPVFAQSENSVG